MTDNRDHLYKLLPAIYRTRDAEQGYPLRALLQIIAEQVDVVETDIDQLYNNWFIETCAEWVVPYIGDLVGYRLVHEAGEPQDAEASSSPNRILIPRRDVADTIRNRRRKGTLALLEELAFDVAQWPARAVEFYKQLAWTQNLNFARLNRGGFADLRHGDSLDRLNGPFEESSRSVDVRRINSDLRQGRYNIPSVGLFVWRLQSHSITHAPAFCKDRRRYNYTFSILGNDTPLFTKSILEPSPTHIADEMNVPAPIRRRGFEERPEDYYGPGKSLAIYREEKKDGGKSLRLVPLENIVVADLTDWAYQPVREQVAVDPQLGRIAFSSRRPPEDGVWVSYSYGFSADIGGGEYDRPILYAADVIKVGAGEAINKIADAIKIWDEYRKKNEMANCVIEFTDSGCYTEQVNIELRDNERLELRAAANKRPVIRLLDFYSNRPDAMQVKAVHLDIPADSGLDTHSNERSDQAAVSRSPQLVLDGLMIAGRGMRLNGAMESLTIRHCTFVPGWSLDEDCKPEQESEPSIELIDTNARVTIEHSIIGSIQVVQNERETDPIPFVVSDSVIDATSSKLEAFGSPDCPVAHATLNILRSTVIGHVNVHAIELAENSIFDGQVRVARRQTGCMRFCYCSPNSRTPRRFNCQPDMVRSMAKGDLAKTMETLRVRPQFSDHRYGKPGYCQLSINCADEIKRGADDQSEMGVFHDLFQPQREANLRARLDEYTPAGMNAGIIFVS